MVRGCDSAQEHQSALSAIRQAQGADQDAERQGQRPVAARLDGIMSILLEPTPDGSGRYLDWILSGLGWTLSLAIGSWIIALVVGTLVGVMRTLPGGMLPRAAR